MKKVVLSVFAVVAASAIGAGAAYLVTKSSSSAESEQAETKVEYVTREVERTPQLGSQFASYQSGEYPDLTYAAENAVQAVVNIEVVQQVAVQSRGGYDPFLELFGIPQQGGYGQSQPKMQERRAGGSGVIITDDGYIVTNNHVVNGASKVRVNLYDGRSFDADIVGTDPTTDIALVKINQNDLPTLPFGSSDALRLGEWVLAIGSPFDLQSTITAGIVSAKARQLDVIPSDFRIESFIQTDAAVNPGNSGGALVNTHGELVGINTVIKSQTGTYMGYSFAVPESIVKKVVMDLKEYGMVQRAMLGIQFRPIDQTFIDELGDEYDIDAVGGVYVVEAYEDGAAAKAGIRKGDVIVSINGVELNDKSPLQEQIGKHRPGDKIKIIVKRGDAVKHFDVTLRNKVGREELLPKESVDVVEALGGKFTTASEKLCKRLGIKGGVEVASIASDGLLAKTSVRPGFVITQINGRNVYSTADLSRLIESVKSIDGIYPDGREAGYAFVQ